MPQKKMWIVTYTAHWHDQHPTVWLTVEECGLTDDALEEILGGYNFLPLAGGVG